MLGFFFLLRKQAKRWSLKNPYYDAKREFKCVGKQHWIFIGRVDVRLKLQYFGHLMWRTDSLEKTLMLGKIEGSRRRDNRGWDGWMASPTQWTWVCANSRSSLVARMVKSLPTVRETQVWSLGQKDPLEKEMATHSSILAWKIPWTEELGKLQSMGLQRVTHDWATSLEQILGDSKEQGSIACCSPWGSQRVRHDLPTEEENVITFITCCFSSLHSIFRYFEI